MADQNKQEPQAKMDWSHVDFSKLSDSALKSIAKDGDNLDFSKMHDDDLKVIAAPPDKGFGPTADGKPRAFKDVNWLAAIGDELINGHAPNAVNMSVTNNPLLAGGPPVLPGISVLGEAVAGPAMLGPLGRMAQTVKAGVSKYGPEIAKDAGSYVAGEVLDKVTGNKGGGIEAALARRIFGRRK